MTRHRVPFLAVAVVLLATGCTADGDNPAAPSRSTAPAPSGPTTQAGPPGTTGTPAPPPAATNQPGHPAPTATATATGHRVTYGWAVPTRPVRITHQVRPPVAPAPAPPLPVLVEVRTGDHPDQGYSRVTFAFQGATPSYEFSYVPRIVADATGDPVPLAGNAFVQIRFDPAQAHDERGRPTVPRSAPTRPGYPTLRGLGFAGDYEGYVTYGLGVRVAPNSDQALPVRVLELTRSDGTLVVAVDVRRG